MRKDKNEKNKINYISNLSNKYSGENNKNSDIPCLNIEKNAGVKLTVGNKLLEMEKNHQKILELEKIIELQNNKINILNQGVEPYNIKIQELNSIISQIKTENNILKQNELNFTHEIEDLKNKMNEEIRIKNELMDSNKRLQEKIESLNHQLNSFKLEFKKEQEEYKNMCRVKCNFEDKIIQLTEDLQKVQSKLQIEEKALNQKDKYIQMLINKKNNIYHEMAKEKEKNNEINENNKNKYNIRPQSSGIKNKNILKISKEKNMHIIEQENIIKKLKEKIFHLEKDNAGLLIRLKNKNSFKTIKKNI